MKIAMLLSLLPLHAAAQWMTVNEGAARGMNCLTVEGKPATLAADCDIQASDYPELCVTVGGQCAMSKDKAEANCGAIEGCAGVYCASFYTDATRCLARSKSELAFESIMNHAGVYNMLKPEAETKLRLEATETKLADVEATETKLADVATDYCFVAEGETLGPSMRDNVDVFGHDWIKYWSSDGEHGPTRPETESAHTCCMVCAATKGCDYWTYHKGSFGCYLKSQQDLTVYVDQYNPDRISGHHSPQDYNAVSHGEWDTEKLGWIPNAEGDAGGRRRLAEKSTLPVIPVSPSNNMWGVDFVGSDWVKFTAGRVEATNAYVV